MRIALGALVAALAACDAAAPIGPRSTMTAVEAAAARGRCAFAAGTPPGLSLARDAPLGGQIPIDTIVILQFENRSFDHLLGNLPAYGQPDVEVAPPGAANRAATGESIAR